MRTLHALSQIVCLVLVSSFSAFAQEAATPELSLEEKEAIHSLILSLEELEATPEKVDKIAELFKLYTQDATAEIKKAEEEISELETQIAEAEKKRQSLERRLKALPVAKALLLGDSEAVQPEAEAPAAPPSETAAPAVQPTSDLFETKVLPIFQKNCIGCHGPEKQKSGLRLDLPECIRKGGDFGPIIEPGNPDKSFLIQAVLYKGDVKMPPKNALSEEDVAVLCDWVKQGAPMPESLASAPAPSAVADPAPTGPESDLFTSKIQPILTQHCIGCHGPEKQKAGLRLDLPQYVAKGSDNGPIFKACDPDNSLIVQAICYQGDLKMPPKEQLPQECITEIIEWIKVGAPLPGVEPPASEPSPAQAEPEPSAEAPAPSASDVFTAQIQPILAQNCVGCHGPEKQKAGLRLDLPECIAKGSENGPILVAGDPDKSPIVQAICYQGDLKMPPKQQLPQECITQIIDWIKAGASLPGVEAPASSDSVAPKPDVGKAESTPESNPAVALFHEKVWPVLESKCVECHGPEKQKSGLRVDSLEALLKGGEFGPVLAPGEPDKSYLVEALRHTGDVHMPPKEKLSQETVDAIAEWVKLGAPWPTQKAAAGESASGDKVALLDTPWSFEPLKKKLSRRSF